ncbi:MAG: HAD-IIIA family hydrolase [Bacteroidetes bacterium]|nr:MAG: HAD-IIIA family hydrolase [Bacteroidota bacterium]
MSIDKEVIERIKCFVFDVDGVLTDGTVIALESGEQARSFNIKDGYAIEQALRAGYLVAIISGGNQVGVHKRLSFLKIPHIYLGVKNKVDTLLEFCKLTGITPYEILYAGDDMPDFEVMKLVGVPCCPADASHQIKEISTYVSEKAGGHGFVRELIEMVMNKQGKWHNEYLQNINN